MDELPWTYLVAVGTLVAMLVLLICEHLDLE